MPVRSEMSYKKAGVDITAADRMIGSIRALARSTHRPGLMAGVGGFSALFGLPTRRYRRPVLVSSTDGVGTKLKIGFMTGVHHTVGIDLVAMGVNDILTQGAEPLFFLDYFATGKLRPKTTLEVVRGIAEGCRRAECTLIGGETAEMPMFYPNGEYDLAGFAVGMVERAKIPRPSSIASGDCLIGLPSSGLHSNGFSLARKILLDVRRLKLGSRIAELGRTLGEELLEPTVIYTKVIRALFKRHPLKGVAHITGGGIPGNLSRVLPAGKRAWVKRGSWPQPVIFDLIQRLGPVSQEEMDRTFNNGLGMILIVGKRHADQVKRSLKRMGESHYLIGEVKNGGKGVNLVS